MGVQVYADTDKANRDLLVTSRTVDSVGDSMSKTGRKGADLDKATAPSGRLASAGKQLQSSYGGVETVMGLAAVGVGLFAKQSLDAASDLSEQQAKIGVVFEDSADSVLQWGQDASGSIGMSNRAALEAAGTYGNMFRAMGMASNKSAEMSVRMTNLAADLASFNNANPSEVLDAIRAGLSGETEPLRRFGVFMNEARVQSEAFRTTGKRTATQLTELDKVNARYNIILKDTTLAQGDYARTADSVANSTRTLSAVFEDLQAAAGSVIEPLARFALPKVTDEMKDLTNSIKSGTVPGLDDLAGMMRKTGATSALLEGHWFSLNRNVQNGTEASKGNAAQQKKTAEQTKNSEEVAKLAAAAEKERADTLKSVQQRLAQAIPAYEGYHKKQDATRAASEKLTEAQKDLSRATAAYKSDKSVTNLEALQDATKKVTEAQRELKTASGLTAAQINKNRQEEVAAFRDWSKNVQILLKRGADPKFVEELSKKGPEYVAAYARGTLKETKQGQRWWNEVHKAMEKQQGIEMDLASGNVSKYRQRAIDETRATNREWKRLHGQLSPATKDATDAAAREMRKFAAQANAALGDIDDEPVKLTIGEQMSASLTKRLSGAQHGMRIPGYGGGDSKLIMVEPGEAVIPKEEVAKADFQMWAKEKGIPGFQHGGAVSPLNVATFDPKLMTRAGNAYAEHLAKQLAPIINKQLMATIPTIQGAAARGGGGVGGTVGNAAHAWRVFAATFGLPMGGRAPRSNPSDHPFGKAIDIMTSNRSLHRQIIGVGQGLPGSKYWISYRQIGHERDGFRPRYYGGPSPHTDHVHWSFYEKGGWLTEPTMGIGLRTGRRTMMAEKGPEYVSPRGGVMGGASGVHVAPGASLVTLNVEGSIDSVTWPKVEAALESLTVVISNAARQGGMP